MSKSKAKPAITPQQIDRCAYLLARKAEAKPWLDELTKLQALAQDHCEQFPADQSVRLPGDRYYLDLGLREERREIFNQAKAWNALKQAMGLPKLIQAVKITFKLLDASIPVDEQGAYVSKERTGSRDMTGGLIELPAVESPKAA